jgi:hypothetical protein
MDVTYFENPDDLERFFREQVEPADIVLDIGPGIYPINYFVPRVHILVEPHEEYVNILQERFQDHKNFLVLKGFAIEALRLLPDDSVDSAFLIDVIEHLEKQDGFEILGELDRVTRKQIIVFTPLGFMPQHVEIDKKDRWGFHGGDFQEHKSGWLPEDFNSEWKKLVCQNYHVHDDNGKPFDKPFGAFYAIKNVDPTSSKQTVAQRYEFFRPTAHELELKRIFTQLADLNEVNKVLSTNLKLSLMERESILKSRSWKITWPIRATSDIFKRAKYIFCKVLSR